MCLSLNENSVRLKKNLRRRKKPIIAYKIVEPTLESQYTYFQWPESGEVKSNRSDTKLTTYEKSNGIVDKGFHFFVLQPEKCKDCSSLKDNFCDQRHNQCAQIYPTNRILKCEIQPKDIVTVGDWGKYNSLVATKCKVLEVL